MYSSFFGLERKAFDKTPDPDFLYRNEEYQEALSRLLYAVEERELCLLLGPVGTGKTLLTRAVMDRLGESHEVAVIVHSRLAPGGFLRTVAAELRVDGPSRHKSELVGQIQDRLFDLDEAGRSAVLIIDEAHLIPSRSVFEEVRLLMNYQLDDRNLVAVMIVGQPRLRKRLQQPAYEALTQRIGAWFELAPLSEEETGRYIAYRLRVAGSRGREIFSGEAVEVIHRASRGVPRVINNLATQCLLEGLGAGRNEVDASMAEEVVASMPFLPGRS